MDAFTVLGPSIQSLLESLKRMADAQERTANAVEAMVELSESSVQKAEQREEALTEALNLAALDSFDLPDAKTAS